MAASEYAKFKVGQPSTKWSIVRFNPQGAETSATNHKGQICYYRAGAWYVPLNGGIPANHVSSERIWGIPEAIARIGTAETPVITPEVAQTVGLADSTPEGRKRGKIRMELVYEGMPHALEALGQVMTWAIEAKGYKEGDFLIVPNGPQKYRGAMLRHDLKECKGETHDDESQFLHAAHTAWNAMARLERLLREQAGA